MERSIGLDVHAASTTAAVIDARGKRVGPAHVLETHGQVLVEFMKTQPGRLHVGLEEGAQSTWLVEILQPHVAEIVVTHVATSRGPKDDARDAFALAERLRTHADTTPVDKQVGTFGTLRQLARAHAMVVQDTVRVPSRIKALFRARGITVEGKAVDSARARTTWLDHLPASSRGAAEVLVAQYDAVCAVRDRAHKDLVAESHRHAITRLLETCPGLGGIRVAQRVAIVVTPARFRTRQQFWS
jgi:hypothetical protein